MNRIRRSQIRSLAIWLYWGTTVLLGIVVLRWTALNWQTHDLLRFYSYLVSALVASMLKVRLPGVTGTASVSFLFVLIGIVDLSLPEAIAIAAASMLVQCYFRAQRRPKAVQVCFNLAISTTAAYVSAVAYAYFHAISPEPVALFLLAAAYYFGNTFPVAAIISLTEALSLRRVFIRNYRWLLPYYAGGASLAWLIGTMPRAIQWEVPIICLPVVYLVHRSYSTYLVQMEQDKKHVEELNAIHMRTIETLALAIDAKDHTTHNHLQRVQLYSIEIGKELGLSRETLDALRAASMLHDIGKLAVPEHIISKPGKLTPAEFQKMKIHPVVGAEILERVEFPYPVVPIIRSHHEKWDGSGYPDGLSREEIPIGARILSVVDCFDALASDRQYRRALPIDEAMARVVSEAGSSFDPTVVEVLRRRYREWETTAREMSSAAQPVLSTDICVTRGAAPAAGFAPESDVPSAVVKTTITSLEMPSTIRDLSLDEAVAVAAVRIKRVIAYDAIAFYARDGDILRAAFVSGSNCSGLWGLNVPVGTGLVGWVAEVAHAIINGNPAVEPGYNRDEAMADPLRSALAIPIGDRIDRVLGVLAVYRRERESFSPQHADALMRLSRQLAEIMQGKESDVPCIALR